MAECNCDQRASTLKLLDWNQCLCHKEGVSQSLTSFTDSSWNTFKIAANIRKDSVYDKLSNFWEEGPRGFYHRKCYQKDHTSRMERKRAPQPESAAATPVDLDPPPAKRQTRAHVQPTTAKQCIICQSDRRSKDRSESLAECQTFQAGQTLLSAAETRQDRRLLLALRGKDPIAIEVKYHRVCYANYTNKSRLAGLSEDTATLGDEDQEGCNGCFPAAGS